MKNKCKIFALFLGSPLVLIYALMGGLIWQLVFRPLEEDDLLQNFGEAYENYRRECAAGFLDLDCINLNKI